MFSVLGVRGSVTGGCRGYNEAKVDSDQVLHLLRAARGTVCNNAVVAAACSLSTPSEFSHSVKVFYFFSFPAEFSVALLIPYVVTDTKNKPIIIMHVTII